SLDLTSTVLTSVEKLAAGTTLATTFLVDQGDLASGGSVIGTGKNDTLTVKGGSVDLTSTTLSSIEILTGTSTAVTFKVDQADLVSGGTVIGGSGNDTVSINGGSLDLTSTTLSGVEILKAGTSNATTFTVDQSDLAKGGSVIGSTGHDVLISSSGTSL